MNPLEGLNASQLRAVTTRGSVDILGGPGCGKTRVIAARAAFIIQERVYAPEQIVALTYTRSMAGDLTRRIRAFLPALTCPACGGSGAGTIGTCGTCMGSGKVKQTMPLVGTLHSLAARWIKAALAGEIAGGDEVRALGWVKGDSFGIALPEDVKELLAKLKTSRTSQGKLREGLSLCGPGLEERPPHAAVRLALASESLVRYDDLMTMLKAVVEAAPLHDIPHLRDRHPCLFVDEAHDLTPMHWSIIDAWAPSALTTVGDDAQRIFGFLLGDDDIDLDNRFMMKMRSSDGVVRLGENYRSSPHIVRDGEMVRDALVEDGAASPLSAIPKHDPVWARPAYITHDDEGLAPAVIDAVNAAIGGPVAWGGRAPDRVAVLARTWAELETAGVFLLEAGLPAVPPVDSRRWWRETHAGRVAVALAQMGARGGRSSRLQVERVLEALGHTSPAEVYRHALARAAEEGTRLARQLDDGVAGAGLPDRWWAKALSIETLAQLVDVMESLRPFLGATVEGARSAVHALGPGEGEVDEELTRATSLHDLLTWLTSGDADARTAPAGHITLTTFHGAKGLEWDAVIILGACEGRMPSVRDRGEAQVHEVSRALYVGMTRPRESLCVLIPTEHAGHPREATRWLRNSVLKTTSATKGRRARDSSAP
ncbi:MAG: ATP-dependent helicase [Gammaproteobacteria bacterium]|nr:ATP-dependent helicase [Gammaproteobacteria bacterium]